MSRIKRALLMIGSPRAKKKSNSESLGTYLLDSLARTGIETFSLHLQRSLRTEEGSAVLFENFRKADLVILSSPLYVDSLPAPVIQVMENIANQGKQDHREGKRFMAIVNCGFPEAAHTETALAICRRFAREAGLEWVGGLGLGGGEAIGGRSLSQAGRLVRNVRRSLDVTAAALASGRPIPKEAVDLMAKPLIPHWLYRWIGDWGWKRQAKHYGTRKELLRRPFLP